MCIIQLIGELVRRRGKKGPQISILINADLGAGGVLED